MSSSPSSFDISTVLIIIGIFLFSGLISIGGLTLFRSIQQYIIDKYKKKINKKIKNNLFEYLSENSTKNTNLVKNLNRLEKKLLQKIVVKYLQKFSGKTRRKLQDLAKEISINKKAKKYISKRSKHKKLKGLSLIYLLDIDISEEKLINNCVNHPETKTATARIFSEKNSIIYNKKGIELLLESNPYIFLDYP